MKMKGTGRLFRILIRNPPFRTRWYCGRPSLRRPGLDPGPRFLFGDLSDQVCIKIEPVRIGLLDQNELPFAPPSLHALLVRNAFLDRFAAFGPDETMQTISSSEIGTVAAAMLPIPPPEQNTSGAPGQDRKSTRLNSSHKAAS